MGEDVTGIDWGFWALVLTAYMALCSVFYFQVLKHEESRNDFIQKIESKIWIEFYRKLVNWLLDRLQVWFGNRISSRSFSLCFILAYVYPAIFFVWAYSWGNGSNEFAGIVVFDPNSSYKNWYLPGSVIFLAMLLSILWDSDRIGDKGVNTVVASVIVTTSIIASVAVAGAFTVYGSAISAGTFAFVFIFAFAVAFVVAVTVAAISALAAVFAFAFVFALAFSVVLTVISLNQDYYLESLLFSVLLIMLPLINAFLDWISWAYSRYFLKCASMEDRVLPIIKDCVKDLLLAVIFMGMLCLVIPAGAELLNYLYARFVGQDIQFDWNSLAVSARDDPWGEGLMVTLMILSTLIPTVMHIVLALIALVLKSFMGNPILRLLREHDISQSDFPLFGVTGLVTAYFVGILVAIGCLYQFTVWAFSFNVSKGLYDMTMLVWG